MTKNFNDKSQTSETADGSDYGKILREITDSPESAFTKDGLPTADAEVMVRNYKQVAGNIPGKPTKQNTRSVWFPLEDLINLVDRLKAEKLALQQGDPNKEDGVTDGVRIYFGRYKKHLNHAERNTVIFVSTHWVKNGDYHQDYFNNVKMTEPVTNVKMIEPFNNGELSPPNNMGVSWGSEID